MLILGIVSSIVIRSFVCTFVSFSYVSIFTRSYLCSVARSFGCTFVRSCVRSVGRTFVRSFGRTFVRAFVYPLAPAFVHSVVFIHSFFVRLPVPLLFFVRTGLFISAVFYSSAELLVCVKVYFISYQ